MIPMTKRDAIIDECKKLDARGDIRKSIDLIGQSLFAARDQVLLFERGVRFEQIGDNERALKDYSEAIHLIPSPRLLIARGRLLCDQLGRPNLAIEDFKSALEQSPQHAMLHRYLCLCYLLLEKNDDALRHAKLLVTLEPGCAASHLSLGQCLLAEDRFNGAAKELRIATTLDPLSVTAWTGLARAMRNLGRLEEAKKCIHSSLRVENSASGWIALGSLLLEMKEPDNAIDALQNAKQFKLTEGETMLVSGYLGLAEQNGDIPEQNGDILL